MCRAFLHTTISNATLVEINLEMPAKLNLWQTILLFLPFAAGELFIRLSYSGGADQRINFAIANLLTTFGMALVICYQTYLVSGFIKVSNIKPGFFQLNALIPAVFTVAYFLYVAWGTIAGHVYTHRGFNSGPLRQSQLHGRALIVLILLLHAFITFYFVNNQFVSGKIKKIVAGETRKNLTDQFLTPMKLLTKISILAIACSFLVSAIIDRLTYANPGK